jgi:hypothetical protein
LLGISEVVCSALSKASSTSVVSDASDVSEVSGVSKRFATASSTRA